MYVHRYLYFCTLSRNCWLNKWVPAILSLTQKRVWLNFNNVWASLNHSYCLFWVLLLSGLCVCVCLCVCCCRCLWSTCAFLCTFCWFWHTFKLLPPQTPLSASVRPESRLETVACLQQCCTITTIIATVESLFGHAAGQGRFREWSARTGMKH